ncbi:MAG TPA: D-glycerate dehydrogenase [Methylomirabilota bacterium]|jgi:glyoxylate reductase|nr:D-glycerate dehydrogenase [Methylomirabilota bacterium]
MAARSIFVTWPMEAEARAILDRVGTVATSHTEHELPVADLARLVADCDAIIPMGAHPIPDAILAAAPRLRIVAVAAVGYNIVDVAAATRRGILVTNTPGVLTETTADMAWALMLGVARRVPESDRFVRGGKWTGVYWSQLMGADVHGATLGVVGLGRIGQAIARRGQGFGMRLLYHNRERDPEAERTLGAQYRAKADLLREADFVVLSIPLSQETRHWIGAAELALMKPTAFLVNVARGPVVDEAALVEALRTGRIAGAGLDVFEEEPKLHPGLLELENLALTPHIGSASRATRLRMASRAAENCAAALEGRRPPNLVNPEAWRPA